MAPLFNKIRLAYLDDLENDPEIAEIISSYATEDGFIHAKVNMFDSEWSKEFVEKFNIHSPSSMVAFDDMSRYWWEIVGDQVHTNVRSRRTNPRPLNPSPGWDVYYHPELKISVIFGSGDGGPPIEDEQIKKILAYAIRKPEASGVFPVDMTPNA